MKQYVNPEFPHFLHGADYNPEQWLHDTSVWDADMELMNRAKCNEMTVGVFSWAKLEPREGEFDFSFMDAILDKIHAAGGKVILATPSGARPRWLAEKYPEVLRVGADGVREHFRVRHNHCLTSPAYRNRVAILDRELAKRYGHHPAVIAWHISNELQGDCHCPLCQQAFREFLREKYDNDISKLNLSWWTTFWSKTYDSFDQVEPPAQHTDSGIHGLNLDWRRFVTRQTASFIRNEAQALGEFSDLPTTINMMFEFGDTDYYQLAREVDFISWDSYPEWHNGDNAVVAQKTAFWHDVYRSMKDKPFLLMESTPSCVNWKPINKLKKPGMDVLSSLQAVAHGSDSVQYFQFRKSRGSSEKLHGAVVGHDGTADTRVFRAVRRTGEVLEAIDRVCGSGTQARVAVIMDWENRWALDDAQGYAKDDKQYLETCYAYHRLFWQRGMDCDVVSPKKDLSRYDLVVAPMLYLTDAETIQNLKNYVAGGGALWATYALGTVNETDLCHLGGIPGGALKDVFGIVAEEVDTLYPEERAAASFDGEKHELADYCEMLRLRGARVLGQYESDWYAGAPAVTEHRYGQGRAVYQAARDTGSLGQAILEYLIRELGLRANVPGELPKGVTAHSRTDGEKTYLFVENYYGEEAPEIELGRKCTDLLTGETVDRVKLPGYGFGVYQIDS